jgi:hypothetical protein
MVGEPVQDRRALVAAAIAARSSRSPTVFRERAVRVTA